MNIESCMRSQTPVALVVDESRDLKHDQPTESSCSSSCDWLKVHLATHGPTGS